MNKNRFLSTILISALGAILLTGCPPKKKLAIEETSTEEKAPEDTAAADATATDASDIQITQEWTDIPALTNVNFDYDSASLDTPQRDVLKKNVAILKKLPKSVSIRVEGHCDSRGTVEYNIALGQRRADAVRAFYKTSGLGADRMKTISFGEERPLCSEESESCWNQNRRSSTKVRNSAPITVKAEELE